MKTGKKALMLLLAAIFLTGCASPLVAQRGSYRIWLIAKSLETDFWKAAISGASAAKTEYNIDLTICGPQTEEDYEGQNRMIRDAIESGADAIVFSAISYEKNAAAIDEAANAGVKIVIIDSDVDSERVNARIGTDNVSAGKMAAEAVLSAESGPLTAGIVNFDLGSRNGQEREQGFRSRLGESGRVNQTYVINVPTDREAAKNETKQLLAEHPEINVLTALNEPLSVGAAEAIDELQLSEDVALVAFDANLRCVDLMRSGAVKALIVQNPYAMGYLGVETCWNLLEGNDYQSDEWFDTATTTITKENLFSPESERVLFVFE